MNIYIIQENPLSLGCSRSGTKLIMKARISAIYTSCIAEMHASMLR